MRWPPLATNVSLSPCGSSLTRDVGCKNMKIFLTAIILSYAASIYAAAPTQTLDDGIYAFKVVAHKEGRDQPYDDPPLDCELTTSESGFILTPTIDVGWTINGSISNETVRLKWNQEHLELYELNGVQIIYEGRITGPNHIEGTHQLYGELICKYRAPGN